MAAWQDALTEAGAADADLLHLSHLTPMHEAAIRSFPDVPRVGHLHGTEMLMLNETTNGLPKLTPPSVERVFMTALRLNSDSF